MKLSESPVCNCGFSPQNLNHLFWACPLLIAQRQKIYYYLKQLKHRNLFSIKYLLGNISKTIVTIICKFIRKIENTLNLRM